MIVAPSRQGERDQPTVCDPSAACKPYRHNGREGGVGVLLIHGLTASPTEVQPIADFLRQRDPSITLSCPLLPGHGTTPEDLRLTKPEAWTRTIADEIDDLARKCTAISVIGVSLGAVLAARAALDDNRISSVGLLAPVFEVNSRAAPFMSWLQHVKPYIRKSRRSLEHHRANGLFSYDRYPMTSLVHLRKLGQQVRKRLGELKMPVLLAAGRRDRYVPWPAVESLRTALGETDLTFVECPNSAHVLPHEPDAAELFNAIDRFLQAHRPDGAMEAHNPASASQW